MSNLLSLWLLLLAHILNQPHHINTSSFVFGKSLSILSMQFVINFLSQYIYFNIAQHNTEMQGTNRHIPDILIYCCAF